MKRSLLRDAQAIGKLRSRLLSEPRLQPHFRKNEPDWAAEVGRLGLAPQPRDELVAALKLLWVLPYADLPVVRDLLLFRYSELPGIESQFREAVDTMGVRVCALYRPLLTMLLQGNSVVPQTATHLAQRLQLAIKTPSAERDWLLPLLAWISTEKN
jgi:hypothetical protein